MQRPERLAGPGDPYSVLGLERGASLDEVKRAYRRMAKQTHPDAAGQSGGAVAVRRFLRVQAAYQAILAAAAASLAGPGASGSSAGRRTENGRPGWRRSRPPGSGTARTRHRPEGADAREADAAARESAEEIARRTARLGSTSYDDATADEPDWDGASWYGVSSGTYWTVNPREYADPRKHGPEYQSRGRRLPPTSETGQD